MHEFGVRYRAEWARKNPTAASLPDYVKDALREQYEQEQDAKRSPSVEPPEPMPEREKEREPEEPEP